MRKQGFSLFILGALAVLMAGCASTGSSFDDSYLLESVAGTALPGNVPVEIRIIDGQISGRGPINLWSAPVKGKRIGSMISTRRAGPPQVMDLEFLILDSLEGGKLKTRNDGRLSVIKDGQESAVFVRL